MIFLYHDFSFKLSRKSNVVAELALLFIDIRKTKKVGVVRMAEEKRKVDLANLKGNSFKEKEEKKQQETKQRTKAKPVINKDSIVSTKKPVSKKIVETFIEDDVKDVKKYFVQDVVIPGLKNGCLELLETMFFGETGRRRSRGDRRDRYAPRSGYSSYYRRDNDRRSDRRDRDRRENDRYESRNDRLDYRNIILRNRADANEIVDKMIERIEEFDACSVADFFDMLDLTSTYQDNNWGWTDDRDIRVRRVSSGFLIDVPEAKYLD